MKAPRVFDINYIDSSSICAFARCPAKYMLSRQLGLQKRDRMMLALDYGTDMHEAIPYCYKEETKQFAVDLFTKRWKAREPEYNDARNIEMAERTLMNFANSHIDMCPYEIVEYEMTVANCEEISKNEVPFLIDIGGPLCLAGRIDAAVRWKSDGSLFALDYKTTREISPRFFSNFENSSQAIAYTIALEQIANEKVRGLIIEAIRVSKAKAESNMHIVFIKDHQIAEYIEFANKIAEQILDCNDKQEWPIHCTGCAPYSSFGMPGYMCDFINICDAPNHEDMYKFFKQSEPFSPFKIDTPKFEDEIKNHCKPCVKADIGLPCEACEFKKDKEL